MKKHKRKNHTKEKTQKEKATKEKNNPSWLLIFVPVFIKS